MSVKIAIAALACLEMQSVSASDRTDRSPVAQDIRRYDQLNLACRGGSGDDPQTQLACQQRKQLEQSLRKRGWCYSGDWKKCAPTTVTKAVPADGAVESDWKAKQIQIAAKQDCLLMSGTISLVPLWRDNNVPLSKIHANLNDVMMQTGATESEKKKWHQLATSIYGSLTTSAEVEHQIRPTCDHTH